MLLKRCAFKCLLNVIIEVMSHSDCGKLRLLLITTYTEHYASVSDKFSDVMKQVRGGQRDRLPSFPKSLGIIVQLCMNFALHLRQGIFKSSLCYIKREHVHH